MKKKKKTLLWQLNGKNLPAPSYLLGTMHIKPQNGDNWLLPLVPKIEACEGFATEINLEEVDAGLLQEYAQLPDNQLLTDLIPPKKFRKLERIFHKIARLPLRALIRTKPFFISNMLSEKILSEQNTVSMDSELFELAKEMGKEVGGIETFAAQLAVINKIPMDYQLKALLKMGKNASSFRKGLQQMHAVYENGDPQKIHKMAKKGVGGIKKIMLYDRNEIMANNLFEKIQKKSIFCALGAGHLGGKKGVLRLLKLKGLKLKPL